MENSLKCVPPLEKGAAKGRDRLPRRGRIQQNGQRAIGDARKKGQRMCSADRYDELYPCGALYPAPLARPFFKGLLRWRDGGILLS